MKKRKPKICVVTWFHCLRNVKLSIGAWLQGYELELITRQQGYDLMRELMHLHIYDNVRLYENGSQLEAQIKKSDADVFWCHNEPDLLACVAGSDYIKKNRIVIHDIHDLPSLHYKEETCPTCNVRARKRLTEFDIDEAQAMKVSDYMFVPTEAYVPMIKEKYGQDKKVEVVYSCSPSTFFPDSDFPRSLSMLYCGQVNVPEMKSRLPYRDVLPLFKYLISIGIPAAIFHTNPGINLDSYQTSGAEVCGALRMWAAMHQYTRYSYGFVGSNVDCQEIQLCMPNKLFDCMAAGIPLIALNASYSGEFILKHGIGVSIQGLQNMSQVPWLRVVDGVVQNYDFWEEKRHKVREIRHEFTAEKVVQRVFDKIGI